MHNVIIHIDSALNKYQNHCYYNIFLKRFLYSYLLDKKETKLAKKKCYGAKKPTNLWEVNVDNIIISKLIKTENNSKYLIWYLDKVIRELVLILPKMSGYVKKFKAKDGDKSKNNKLMPLRIDDEKLLQLKNI